MVFSESLKTLQTWCIQKEKEVASLKQELSKKDEEIKQLKSLLETVDITKKLHTWNDYILYICRDGKQRTSTEIFEKINEMETKPWSKCAKTPDASCSSACGTLFKSGKLYKTNDYPTRYFILLK